MKISTQLKKENLRLSIAQIALGFAKRYAENPVDDIEANFEDFNDKLKVLLKIK